MSTWSQSVSCKGHVGDTVATSWKKTNEKWFGVGPIYNYCPFLLLFNEAWSRLGDAYFSSGNGEPIPKSRLSNCLQQSAFLLSWLSLKTKSVDPSIPSPLTIRGEQALKVQMFPNVTVVARWWQCVFMCINICVKGLWNFSVIYVLSS